MRAAVPAAAEAVDVVPAGAALQPRRCRRATLYGTRVRKPEDVPVEERATFEGQRAPLDERRSGARLGRTGRAGMAHVSGGSGPRAAGHTPQAVPTEIDLHGLNVEQALACAERALDEALRANVPELRFIHGKSGGRIRGALHKWLRGVRSVRSFGFDPRNEGVTVVSL